VAASPRRGYDPDVPARPSLDPHRLAEERSVAYHAVIAARLARDPAILERARGRAARRAKEGDSYASEWVELLALTEAQIAAHIVERSDRMDALRQSTPFAGALAPRERWLVHREVRERASR
jgi:hypothetical protein